MKTPSCNAVPHYGTYAAVYRVFCKPSNWRKQLSLIGESQELAMGAEQYTPTQQTQGGQFYIDPELTLYVREVGNKLARVVIGPTCPTSLLC